MIKTETDDVKRIINIINQLKKANSDIEAVSSKNWRITVIDDDEMVNASALPVIKILIQ